jgi:hypothetical protein
MSLIFLTTALFLQELRSQKRQLTICSTRVFIMEGFTGTDGARDETLGSHSIRKLAATHARCSGCSKDDKDIRGHWKSKA